MGKEGHEDENRLSHGPTAAEQEQITAYPRPAGLSTIISAAGAHHFSPPCRLSSLCC